MIKKLRRNMTILVIAVLVCVCAGIIVSINYMNHRDIASSAYVALEMIASGDASDTKKPSPPDDAPSISRDSARRDDNEPPHGSAPSRTGEMQARLGNYVVITRDADGNITDWTSARQNLYDEEQIEELAEKISETNAQKGRTGNWFFQKTRNNGETRIVALDQSIELQNARSVLLYSSIAMSIAALLLSIAALFLIRHMVKPVETAFEKQRQFIADASHELKTPLAVISANADVLENEIGENTTLSYIHAEVRRADHLIKSLLGLARMDAGLYSLTAEEMNLAEEINSVLLPFEATVYEAGKTLVTHIPAHVSYRGDKEMIRQLTLILLSNALKYADENSQIGIALTEKGKIRQLRVSNHTSGMEQSDLAHVFDRFYRGDQSHNRSVEGYGLGLTIAENIVKAHNGKIRAACTDGDVTFTVIL